MDQYSASVRELAEALRVERHANHELILMLRKVEREFSRRHYWVNLRTARKLAAEIAKLLARHGP